MNLLEGIIILDENGEDINSKRITKSKGTALPLKDHYLEKSYVPKGKWNMVSAQDVSSLSYKDGSSLDTGSFISLLKVPKEVTSSFNKIRNEIKRGISKQELQKIIPEFKNSENNILPIYQYIDELGKNNRQILIGANEPGLKTVTYDPNDKHKRFIGLHVDNWFQKELSERHLSPRRLCINLGISKRYLLLINLPLKKITELLIKKGILIQNKIIPSTSLGHLFMKEFPSYPVIRIEIHPNEAYIASTENIIHDGSTYSQTNIDVCLHSHGLFYP